MPVFETDDLMLEVMSYLSLKDMAKAAGTSSAVSNVVKDIALNKVVKGNLGKGEALFLRLHHTPAILEILDKAMENKLIPSSADAFKKINAIAGYPKIDNALNTVHQKELIAYNRANNLEKPAETKEARPRRIIGLR